MSNAAASAEDRYREACQRAMMSWNNARRKEWFIWAAIKRPCPECKMGSGLRCVHLGKLKQGEHVGTQWPHGKRVDWTKMHTGLVTRGYIEN